MLTFCRTSISHWKVHFPSAHARYIWSLHSILVCRISLLDLQARNELLVVKRTETVGKHLVRLTQTNTDSVIRIIFIIPVFAVIAFLSVTFEDAAIYIKPFEDLYEAFALASFFLLLCAFVQEDEAERETFFQASGTTKQYLATTIGVFQFPVVMFIVLLGTTISQAIGKYCAASNKVYFAHIWLTIITVLTIIVAISGILNFYKALKTRISHRHPLPKLIGFKGIVFLNFVQSTIFSFLSSSGVLDASPKHTYNDYAVGLPNLIISIEMVLFSLIFLYVYRVAPYNIKQALQRFPLDI